MAQSYSLASTDPGAVCLNGAPASVVAYIAEEPSTDWVLMLGGGSPGLDFCINAAACALFATPPSTPPPPPGNVSLGQGMQSSSCVTNPTWCKANQAMIPMCDMALLMSAATTTLVEANEPANTSAATLHFAGIKILTAAITKLGTLGLSRATSIALHGITHGGTAVVLHADRIAAMLSKVAPGLKKIKAIPVDGIHPKFGSMVFGGSDTWYSGALSSMTKLSGAGANVAAGCAAANKDPGMCLYANETLPFVKTPVFAVQEMPAVWDYQCMYEGIPNGNILQVQCSDEGNHHRGDMQHYRCVQYPDECAAGTIASFTIPLQQAYLANAVELQKKPGNGGFFHSCYLGACKSLVTREPLCRLPAG